MSTRWARLRRILPILFAAALADPALAAGMVARFASNAVRDAAGDPRIAAALAAGAATGDAILAHDAAGFAAAGAPELMINSPADRVLTGAQALAAFNHGLIDYGSSERVIEYAAVRPNGEVLLMGEEHITPRGQTRNAGHAETYRVTEIWRRDGGKWLLSVRQATISEVR